MSFDPKMEAFFALHRDLPREGPGEAADVAWAVSLLELPDRAHVADVACGPGGDIAALLEAAPNGHITAFDTTAHFVQAARQTWGHDGRVTVLRADMKAIANPYDLIWCAGAVYFMGVTAALTAWRKSLLPQGAVVFSEACWFTDTPSPRAAELWAREYPSMTNTAGITAQITDAGYEVLGQRRLSDAAWEAYFTPLEARAKALREDADGPLTDVLDEAEEEIACWRAHKNEFGYLLSVVRPA
ncbi:trans-aconitate 2-methyltransferase [uncultured Sulfitobacter sp.]|uniref:class I SAM-dependent methyltransferase n=1 Tax=uncultured Sulfitobacter sp. TaxID=191468 RepID=UPI002610A26A|nr:class I SAM-dependent methyltransferase [uncultured Sulfitobacter sp.]